MLVEFLLLRRPIAHQSKDAAKRRRTLTRARYCPYQPRGMQAAIASPCQLTLVYFCGDRPADIDNIIKPIQDGLNGVVYIDDSYVSDIDSHRRFLTDAFDLLRLPTLVLSALSEGQEFVYVRVSTSQALELYL